MLDAGEFIYAGYYTYACCNVLRLECSDIIIFTVKCLSCPGSYPDFLARGEYLSARRGKFSITAVKEIIEAEAKSCPEGVILFLQRGIFQVSGDDFSPHRGC